MADIEEIKTLIEQGNKLVETIRTDVDAVKADDVLSKEKLAKMEADLAETFKAKQEAELARKAVEDRLAEVETKLNRPGAGGAPGEVVDEYKEAFLDYVRSPLDPAQQSKMYELQRKAADARTSTAASGGYAVPEVIAREIARVVQEVSPIRSIARVVSVGTPDYKELVDLRGFASEWVGETATRNQTDTPDLSEIAPTFGEIAAKPQATRHSLEDMFFDVSNWLISSGGEEFAKAEGLAFVSGNGTNKPTGFLNGTPVSTADDTRAFGVLQYYATGQAAALATDPFDTFYDAVFGLKAGYRRGSRWVMNSNTMAALAKVKDSNGIGLLQPAVSEDVPDRVIGYGITIAEDMPDIAADAHPIAFGDWRRGYLIADRVGMGLIRDEVTTPGYIKFIMYKRVGGVLKDTNALKLIKVAAS